MVKLMILGQSRRVFASPASFLPGTWPHRYLRGAPRTVGRSSEFCGTVSSEAWEMGAARQDAALQGIKGLAMQACPVCCPGCWRQARGWLLTSIRGTWMGGGKAKPGARAAAEPRSKSTRREGGKRMASWRLLPLSFQRDGTSEETKASQRKGWAGTGAWHPPSAHFPVSLALSSFETNKALEGAGRGPPPDFPLFSLCFLPPSSE